MSDESRYSNMVLLQEFIDLYESLPELWNPTNPEYVNKTKRHIGLQMLLNVYAKIKPNASIDEVRKKINTLRSNYRKELKKIAVSKESATDAEHIYEPTSWVFYSMQFLGGADFSVNEYLTNVEEGIESDLQDTVQELLSNSNNANENMTTVINKEPPLKKQKTSVHNAKPTEPINKYLINANNVSSVNMDVAKVWARKLERLQPRQRLYAEKAINDILFEAELRNLNESVKIDEPSYVYESTWSPESRTSE